MKMQLETVEVFPLTLTHLPFCVGLHLLHLGHDTLCDYFWHELPCLTLTLVATQSQGLDKIRMTITLKQP
jgi:hypothetical protein